MNLPYRKVSLRFSLLAALLAAVICPALLSAAGPVASLDVVPADAVFYSASLRNRETFDKIVGSKAFAKLRDLPYVQMGLGVYQMQATNSETVAGKIAAAMNDPEMRKSLNFVADMLSDEIFVYGGANSLKSIELLQGTMGAVQMAAGVAGTQGRSSTKDVEEAQARAFLKALVDQMALIEVPELVIGFKVKDKAMAETLLSRLEPGLQKAFEMVPQLEGRFKKQELSGHSYFTLTLDGALAPWPEELVDKIRSLAPSPDDGDKLIDRLKKTKLMISLGLRDNFLLLVISPSTDVFTHMGGAATLGTRAELAAVEKYADKPITSVGYTSKILLQKFSYTKSKIDNLAQLGKNMLPSIPGPAKLRDDLEKSIDELAIDIKGAVTEVGATSSIGFFTPEGTEGYNYDWSENRQTVYSQPLDILKHVGGNPIAVVADRSKLSMEDYETLVKWIRTGYRYMEEYGVPQMPPKDRKQFDEAMEMVKPLVARLDKATRDLLLPGLADGQSALVIDAKLTSRQFIKSLPATESPMPMIELAVVLGVSDAEKVKQAFMEYYDVADGFVDVAKTIDQKQPQSEIPKDFKLPRPKLFNLPQGEVYGFVLPAAWGVDSHVLPNAGLSNKVAVLSLSGRHTQRLLTEKEPVIAGITLPTDVARGGVAAIDFVALIDAVTPWVNLALDEAAKQGNQQNAEMVRQHADAVIEVLKCYRGTVAETYLEGNVTVTRTRSQYRDLEFRDFK